MKTFGNSNSVMRKDRGSGKRSRINQILIRYYVLWDFNVTYLLCSLFRLNLWNGHIRMPSCLFSPTGNQSLVNNVRMYVSQATLVLILLSYCLTVFTLFSSFIRICWASSNLFHIWLNYLKIIAANIPFGNWWITLKRRSGIIILNMFFS